MVKHELLALTRDMETDTELTYHIVLYNEYNTMII
jgi:hypothetical protein